MGMSRIQPPSGGTAIVKAPDGSLVVPDRPIIPFIEGDGIGPEVMSAAKDVWNTAVDAAYGGQRCMQWMEVYAGEKAVSRYGEGSWLPTETMDVLRQFLVGVKGPLTTPVGGGIRSLNVTLRQTLDLYVCLRPVRWFEGVPSPVVHPEYTNMVVFRENSEDIYAGIEWASDSAEARRMISFLQEEMGVTQIRFPATSGIGIKPVSQEGTARLVRAAIRYAIAQDQPSVTLVHKGNIMKFTEGAFRRWGYEVAVKEFGAQPLDGGPWHALENPQTGKRMIIKDVMADAFLEQILTRPQEYAVIATLNLNGDYISDALAACVGGIGISPGANINYETGIALFEATHGTAPTEAGKNRVNPGSLILSGEMMLRYLGWDEAADLVLAGMDGAIRAGTVTHDFARMMKGAHEITCSAFGAAVAKQVREAQKEKT